MNYWTNTALPRAIRNEILRSPNLAAVCRDLASQAKDQYQWADERMKKCKPAAMRPARIMRAYYGAILDRLVRQDWRDPFKRVTLPKWNKICLMMKGIFA